MANLSGSKMGLARLCLHWTTQPWPPEETSDAAIIGLWYHAVCAWVIACYLGIDGIKPEEPSCLGDANELTPEADAKALIEEHPDGKIQREVAYVYSPRETRHVGFDIGREYGSLADDEIPATADVVILYPDRAVVVDWKSGRRENTDRAATNAQLAILALCVAEFHGVDEVEVQLRFGDGGRPDFHLYDAFSLVDVKDEVDGIIFDASGASTNGFPEPRPGLHCTSRYCPIRTTCQATVEAVAEVTPGESMAVIAGGTSTIANADHAASLWHRAAAAQGLLDAVIKAVKDYCDANGPVPLGDGKELRQVEETTETIEASAIQEVYEPISAMLEAAEFAGCVKVSVTKGALEKAIKAKAERGKKTVAWQQAMDRLREAGRVKASTHLRHRIKTIKENK